MSETEKYSLTQRVLLVAARWLGPLFIVLLGATLRIEVKGREHFDRASSQEKGLILSIWHGRMLVPIFFNRNLGFVSLVSLSFDGELITRIVRALGYVIHRGSPRKGSREGFKAILRELKSKKVVAMFPDGPTGPAHSFRRGVLHLARLTGAPVVPMLYSGKSVWQAGSWDSFMIPRPFSTVQIGYGEAITIPRSVKGDAELGEYRDRIRESMIKLETDLDRECGLNRE